MYFFFQKKGIFEKFRNNKVKKSESFMTERTASTDCPSSVSHEKVGQCRNNSKYESQKLNFFFGNHLSILILTMYFFRALWCQKMIPQTTQLNWYHRKETRYSSYKVSCNQQVNFGSNECNQYMFKFTYRLVINTPITKHLYITHCIW